eukprot:scpid78778/ scgid12947/ 
MNSTGLIGERAYEDFGVGFNTIKAHKHHARARADVHSVDIDFRSAVHQDAVLLGLHGPSELLLELVGGQLVLVFLSQQENFARRLHTGSVRLDDGQMHSLSIRVQQGMLLIRTANVSTSVEFYHNFSAIDFGGSYLGNSSDRRGVAPGFLGCIASARINSNSVNLRRAISKSVQTDGDIVNGCPSCVLTDGCGRRSSVTSPSELAGETTSSMATKETTTRQPAQPMTSTALKSESSQLAGSTDEQEMITMATTEQPAPTSSVALGSGEDLAVEIDPTTKSVAEMPKSTGGIETTASSTTSQTTLPPTSATTLP